MTQYPKIIIRFMAAVYGEVKLEIKNFRPEPEVYGEAKHEVLSRLRVYWPHAIPKPHDIEWATYTETIIQAAQEKTNRTGHSHCVTIAEGRSVYLWPNEEPHEDDVEPKSSLGIVKIE